MHSSTQLASIDTHARPCALTLTRAPTITYTSILTTLSIAFNHQDQAYVEKALQAVSRIATKEFPGATGLGKPVEALCLRLMQLIRDSIKYV